MRTPAVAAVPATGNDWAFISSGTWSLVGIVLDSPCVTEEARRMNFTNLGGVGGTTCFLKNVNGMWLLRQCLDEWERDGQLWSLEDLVQECDDVFVALHAQLLFAGATHIGRLRGRSGI